MTNAAFTGFPAATRKFLRALAKNNHRDWFTEHKPRYESDVLEPALAFIEAMQAPIEAISPHFLVVPTRTRGSLMRIYRDLRFAKDQEPYKTNVGIQFRHEEGKDVHAPGFYVHIEPNEVFVAAGMWHPDAKALRAVRERIEAEPKVWRKIRDARGFQSKFELAGDSLQRPPRGLDPESEVIEDLKRKDFIAVRSLPPKAVEEKQFAKEVAKGFAATEDFLRFLCEAVGVAF